MKQVGEGFNRLRRNVSSLNFNVDKLGPINVFKKALHKLIDALLLCKIVFRKT